MGGLRQAAVTVGTGLGPTLTPQERGNAWGPPCGALRALVAASFRWSFQVGVSELGAAGSWLPQLVFLDGEGSLAGGAKGRDLGRSGD